MVDVIATDEFKGWYEALNESESDAVTRVVDLLEVLGVGLPFPHSSAIRGASFALFELRATAGKAELRVLYAFDPSRNAVLIIGGDKSGDNRFYVRMTERAERIWREYLKETEQEK